MFFSGYGNALTISDALTDAQRKQWSKTLNFPDYCKNGEYEWLDSPGTPFIYFKKIDQNRTLVYNVCERYAYQDGVNVFVYDNRNNSARLITFPTLVLFEIPGIYTNDNDLADSVATGAYEVELKHRIIQRGIDVLPNDRITVINHYSGTGTCGTFTTYSIKKHIAEILEARARIDCNNDQHDEARWPVYKLSCPEGKQNHNCMVTGDEID
ncbi:hypothetical protein MNBD_GAMMA11-3405 [hydrothermal vent metagenome]|uniref:Uncharacterized protein n=1 Tax=hydrothermal vent metagenome TaxID=652676 RepID=A0A3B0XW32_9ZZZZ